MSGSRVVDDLERQIMAGGLLRSVSKVIADTSVHKFTSLETRPPANTFVGSGLIITPTYRIECTSDGVSWVSHGYSDSIADRPSANALGKGSWKIDNSVYYSNGTYYDKLVSATQLRNIASIGDSTCEQNTYSTGGNSYLAQGPLVQALNLLGWPWNYEVSDNFGIGGSNVRQCIDVQIPLLLAQHTTKQYERCFISTGTNDTTKTLVQRKADLLELFNLLRGVGIIPVYIGIRPRGNDVTVLAYKQQNMAINQWCMLLQSQGLIEFIPVDKVYADTTSIYGNCVITSSNDYLHPNLTGALLEGSEISNYYSAKGFLPSHAYASSQLDTFNRVENPFGVCFNSPNPLLLGGTTAPTGLNTQGGIWAATDYTIANGQTRRKWGVASVVASTVHMMFDSATGTGAFAGDTQPAAGEIVRGFAKINLVSIHDVRCSLQVTENDGVSGLSYYDNLTSFTDRLPDGTYTMYLQSPAVPVREWAGSGNQSLTMYVIVSTGAGATGSFNIEAFEMRVVG